MRLFVLTLVLLLHGPAWLADGAPTDRTRRFSARLLEIIQTGECDGLARSIDYQVLQSRMFADGTDLPDDFLEGMRTGMRQQFGQVCEIWGKAGRWTRLRDRSRAGHASSVMRLIGVEGGVSYMEFIFTDDGKRVQMIDVFIATSGGWMSALMREALLPVIAQFNNDVLSQILDDGNAHLNGLAAAPQLLEQAMAGDPDGALAKFDGLAQSYRHSRAGIVTRIGLAQSSDEATYIRVLKEETPRIAEYPGLDLLTLDHLLLTGQWKQYEAGIARLDEVFGPDAYLDVLRAGALLEQGRLDAAVAASDRAVQAEPELDEAYWLPILAYLEREAWSDAAIWLTRLDEARSIDAELMKTAPEFAGFVQTDEYRRWLGQREGS